MLSVEESIPPIDLDQAKDRKYFLEMMAHHYTQAQYHFDEAVDHLTRYLEWTNQLEEITL
jgi:hypothetical protein